MHLSWYANGSCGFNKDIVVNGNVTVTSALSVGNTVTPTNGVINTVRTVPSANASLTINYLTDTIVRANVITQPFTINHSNYVAGKAVEVHLTYNGGGNATVNHGINGLNTTIKNGGASISLASPSSAVMRFVCLDGTNANTIGDFRYNQA